MPVKVTADTTGVRARLARMSLKGAKKMSVQVVYSAPYAVYVHEDMTCHHPNGGQAKYLEEPARRLRSRMTATVSQYLRRKKSLEEGLVVAAGILLDASRPLVPVDTGFLRDSGGLVITTEDV